MVTFFSNTIQNIVPLRITGSTRWNAHCPDPACSLYSLSMIGKLSQDLWGFLSVKSCKMIELSFHQRPYDFPWCLLRKVKAVMGDAVSQVCKLSHRDLRISERRTSFGSLWKQEDDDLRLGATGCFISRRFLRGRGSILARRSSYQDWNWQKSESPQPHLLHKCSSDVTAIWVN